MGIFYRQAAGNGAVHPLDPADPSQQETPPLKMGIKPLLTYAKILPQKVKKSNRIPPQDLNKIQLFVLLILVTF